MSELSEFEVQNFAAAALRDADVPCTADIGQTDQELEEDKAGTRDLFIKIAAEGVGYSCYGPEQKRYGRSEVIKAVKHISESWGKRYPSGPRIGVGNLSLSNGGRMHPHVSHQTGVDVDLSPFVSTDEEIGVTWQDAKYSRSRTQELVNLILNNPILGVRVILFNDPKIKGVSPFSGHDNHLHVSFLPSIAGRQSEFSSDMDGDLRFLAPFMAGDRVKKLQEDLNKVGATLNVDSVFGRDTDMAVRAFQQRHGLAVDGIVGANTQSKLTELRKAQDQQASTSGKPVGTGFSLQKVISENRFVRFEDLNKSELVEHPEFCQEVQSILKATGFLTVVSGRYDSATQDGLRRFKETYFLEGGDVLGPSTAKVMLEKAARSTLLPNWEGGDRDATIQAIIQEAKRQGIVYYSQIAYILATVEHETANSFQPVKEAYFLGEPAAENTRKTFSYYPFYGRGYVQLTHEYNYRPYSTLLGIDLVSDPDLVMRPDISLFILVDGMKRGVFTKWKLDDFISGSEINFVEARRIINGTDKADHIGNIAKAWHAEIA
jgi:peptidoglycan hydrolase-like protein with peptidoglycan-binding domain